MNFTVYKSSAGSGKTTALVREYVKLIIINPKNFSRILAISFTNKAANEMKSRILRDIARLAQVQGVCDEAVVDKIMPGMSAELKKINFTEFAYLPQKAKQALSYILHNYSDFSVSTIDSFVHSIVRFFASDLYLSHDFNVELDEDNTVKKAVKLLINKAGSDDILTRFLVEYSLSLTDNEKNWNIENELSNFAKILFKENSQIKLSASKLELADYVEIRKNIHIFIKNFENTLFDLGKEAYNIIKSAELDIDDFFRKSTGVAGVFEKLSNRIFVDKLNSYVLRTIEEDVWYTKSTDENTAYKIDNIIDQLRNIINKIYIIYNSNDFLKHNFYNILIGNIYKIALLSEVEKVFEEIRQEENIVHISEFNKRIADIVLKEPVPYIYERLGSYYKHYLIDEFQDTSVLQWLNLLPLIENSLAEGHFNMIVGDGKQAIYRWRNGEVEQFAALPSILGSNNDILLKQREQNLKIHFKEQILNNNYRSCKEIISFNNNFFNYLKDFLPDTYKNIYKEIVQGYNPLKTGGRVEIEFMSSDLTADEIKELQKDTIKNNIIKCIEDGFQYKDIAVIVRDNSNASCIASFLLEAGINVVSSESLLIKNSSKVRFLINIVKFIDDNYNKIACAAALQYLISENIITRYPDNVNGNIFNADNLTKKHFLQILNINNINISLNKLKTLPVYDMFEELIRTFMLADTPDPFLQFLLEVVLDISVADKGSLMSFLIYWEEKQNKLSIELPDEMNAVRVMTIHKSKGLEFPIVIFPYYNNSNKTDMLWVDTNEEELNKLKIALIPSKSEMETTSYKPVYEQEQNKRKLDLLNVLYVVMTRAEKRIYISGSNIKDSKDITNTSDIIKNYNLMFVSYLNNIGIYNKEQSVYIFGDEGKPVYTSTNHINEDYYIYAKNIISNAWENKVRINKNANFQTKEIEWGKLVHQIIANMDIFNQSVNYYDEYLNNYADNEEIRDKLKSLIIRVQKNNKIKEIISNGENIIIEKDIITPKGDVYRPDRIVLKANNASIIDFKTGKHNEQNKKQIDNYAYILADMGYFIDKKYLIYLNEFDEEICEW